MFTKLLIYGQHVTQDIFLAIPMIPIHRIYGYVNYSHA